MLQLLKFRNIALKKVVHSIIVPTFTMKIKHYEKYILIFFIYNRHEVFRSTLTLVPTLKDLSGIGYFFLNAV